MNSNEQQLKDIATQHLMDAYKIYLECKRLGYVFFVDERGKFCVRYLDPYENPSGRTIMDAAEWARNVAKRELPKSIADKIESELDQIKCIVVGESALLPEERPWVHVAFQVLCGEFRNCKEAEAERLWRQLDRLPHLLCMVAVDYLFPEKK
jgi:hypothetical protein